MSQFVAHRIMPCNPLPPATRWVDAPCEVADCTTDGNPPDASS